MCEDHITRVSLSGIFGSSILGLRDDWELDLLLWPCESVRPCEGV
jgi:hypothetical protein